jgi:hypothetical protein
MADARAAPRRSAAALPIRLSLSKT